MAPAARLRAGECVRWRAAGSHERTLRAAGAERTVDSSRAGAYEGIYRLPADATGIRPKGIYRFFACLDDSVRKCPADCRKRLLLDSLIVHLNDDHHWSRERIADWLAGR